jgi:O-antigen/teichoic acid export membrane protein
MNMENVAGERVSAVPPSATEVRALPPLSLRTNFAWTLAGTTIYGLAQWGMIIALTKLGTAQLVGRFAIAQALSAPVVMFTNLQLRIVQATDARNEYRVGDYLTLRSAMSVLALLIIAAVAIVGPYRPEVRPVILLVGAAKCVESISDVIHGLWQKHERLDLSAISMTIKGPTSLAVMCFVMAATHSIVWAVVGMLATWTTVLLTYDVTYLWRMVRSRPWIERPVLVRGLRSPGRLTAMRSLAMLALPLGVVGLLDSLNVNVPRYSIERALGEAALGHFAAMAYIVVAGNMVVNALAQSAAPRLARHYVDDLAAFVRLRWQLVRFGLALGATGVILAYLVGRPLLTALYRAEYAAHADAFVWLMGAAGIGYVARFLVGSMTAARRFRAQAPLYALTLITVAGLSMLLVPRYQLVGAAWAICGCMTVLLIGAIIVNIQAVRQRRPGEERVADVAARRV